MLKKIYSIFIITTVLLCSAHYNVYSIVVESASSGNWNDGSTWVGGSPPSIDDDVIIHSNHQIVLSSTAYVQSLTISEVEVGDSSSLEVANGRNLIISQDLQLNEGGTGVAVLQLLGTVEVGGDLILFGAGDINTAKVNLLGTLELRGELIYHTIGQLVTNSASPGKIVLSGSSAQSLTIQNETVLPDLEINNSSGVTLNTHLTSMNFNGDLLIRSSSVLNLNASIFSAFGSFTMENGATLHAMNGNPVPEFGLYNWSAGSTIRFTSSTQVDIESLKGGYSYPNLIFEATGGVRLIGNVRLRGNLTVFDYPFNANNQTVTFVGSGTQSLNMMGSSNSLHNLTLDKIGQSVELSNDLVISNQLNLLNGVLTTGIGNSVILTNTNGNAITSYSSSSFINGNLRRHIASNNDNYAFPLGAGTTSQSYFLGVLENNMLEGVNYIDARISGLINHNATNFESLELSDDSISYQSVASEAIWIFSPDMQPTSGTYGMKLHIQNLSGLQDNRFAILKRSEGADESSWTPDGTLQPVNGTGRRLSDGFAYRHSYTSFSEFGMGMGESEVELLPVTLDFFQAFLKDDGEVIIDWVTVVEIDCDFFTIERSNDGQNFYDWKTVSGSGNSISRVHYREFDPTPYSGITFYRLRQTDFDGTSETFNIVSVHNNPVAQKGYGISLYPNPVQGGNTLKVNGFDFSLPNSKIKIFHVSSGQLVHESRIDNESPVILLPENLIPGMYILRSESDISAGHSTFIVK